MPWYGNSLPTYFEAWRLSAKHNINYDFLVITDLELKSDGNIIHINMSFEKIQQRIRELFGNKVHINSPYKLCDYKIVYGIIFKEFIKEYDYWGFADYDLIYGNISNFIDDNELIKYDRYGECGHFTLIRNDKNVNNYFLKDHRIAEAFSFEEMTSSDFIYGYDEIGDPKYGYGSSYIIKKDNRLSFFDNIHCADIDILHENFSYNNKINVIFNWKDGILRSYTCSQNKIVSEELMYVHFQKKNLIDERTKFCESEFWIIPGKLVDKLSDKICVIIQSYTLMNNNKTYAFKVRWKIWMNRLKTGAIKQLFKRVLKKRK